MTPDGSDADGRMDALDGRSSPWTEPDRKGQMDDYRGGYDDFDEPDAAQFDKFRWYVRERANMLNLRMSGVLPPWTTSNELATHRFCNVFRVCDRGSQEAVRLMAGMPENSSELDDATLAFAYRRTNLADGWREAVARFGLPLHDGIVEWLREVDASGLTIHTSRAYNVATGRGGKGKTVVGFLADQMESLLAEGYFEDFVSQDTFAGQIGTLVGADRIGKFMAQQIVTDYGYGRSGYDRYEDRGVVVGPGSLRGLRWLFPEDDLSEGRDDAHIVLVHRMLMSVGHPTINVGGVVHDMTLMDTQNCLCEFDKLNRIQSGGGFRRRYSEREIRPLEPLVFPECWKGGSR